MTSTQFSQKISQTKTAIFLNLNPPHRKYYIIELHRDDKGVWSVTGTYGRVDVTSKTQLKYRGSDYYDACNVLEKTINDRYSHGYTLYKETDERAPSIISLVEALLSTL